MTYENALNEITDECRSCCGDGCKDCRTHYVKEALEKQIPKKIVKVYIPFWEYQCPNANCDILFARRASYEHCPGCGQAIDWSDDE